MTTKLWKRRLSAIEAMDRDLPMPEQGDRESLSAWYDRCFELWVAGERPQDQRDRYGELRRGHRSPPRQRNKSDAEVEARVSGRRFVNVRSAAEDLAVGYELLQGLIDANEIDGFRTEGKSGAHMWFIFNDEVERLKASLGSTR